MIDAYCRWLGYFFFAPGYEPEDLAQEARIAAWLAPECPKIAARRQVLDVVKVANRKAVLCELDTEPATTADVVDVVDARERLRGVLAADLTPKMREAIGRVIRGEPIRYEEKALQGALARARRRLAA